MNPNTPLHMCGYIRHDTTKLSCNENIRAFADVTLQQFYLETVSTAIKVFNKNRLCKAAWLRHGDDVPHICSILVDGAVTAKESSSGGVQNAAASPLVVVPVQLINLVL